MNLNKLSAQSALSACHIVNYDTTSYFIYFLIVYQVKYQPLALIKADG
ncbi:Uncharacterised protein [Parabacteroides distasonis]|uniref:Uncharacterized protein n=1 Tax=Parabacteroides distasonis TaxID=823 RepID=A0A173S4M6_PARDI|nr:Uncharacterised protein [Parabacteroides distasonis]